MQRRSPLTRRFAPRVLFASLAVLAGMICVPGVASADTHPSHFIWTSTTSGSYTLINNGATNGNPGAILFVTDNQKPNGVCGCIANTIPVGVFYDTDAEKWGIFYEENPDISVAAGLSFNVLVVPSGSSDAFTVTTTTANVVGDSAYIDNSATNEMPSAILQETPNGNPGGGGIAYNDHVTGVWYDGVQWAVFNEDDAAMPTQVAFNVLVGSSSTSGGVASTLRASKTNRFDTCVIFDNANTNGDSNAFMLETPNWDPKDRGSTYDDTQTGVLYDNVEMDVCHASNVKMVVGDAFNVIYWNS